MLQVSEYMSPFYWATDLYNNLSTRQLFLNVTKDFHIPNKTYSLLSKSIISNISNN